MNNNVTNMNNFRFNRSLQSDLHWEVLERRLLLRANDTFVVCYMKNWDSALFTVIYHFLI